ncbi:uncharacterized protein B0I36DRAFT_316001 [Microdochium trichocladiopsis]|uniref:Uncharacterized protein n=1 Tax=Microdochium trichocladiopsis TaxID=1682393 RepID=A0A9P9BSW9_9PEZI|nr:uncharacterized protein B0I36DRAFT_316001 [Microdochium trichocladiopsis]KAH7038320.1 hypothetical protein B0I36DRAFT_316001 [Microdochium trichocladiopsis]
MKVSSHLGSIRRLHCRFFESGEDKLPARTHHLWKQPDFRCNRGHDTDHVHQPPVSDQRRQRPDNRQASGQCPDHNSHPHADSDAARLDKHNHVDPGQ